LSSTATQKFDEGHDTDTKGYKSMCAGGDQEVPFQVRASPPSSTATQKLGELHDTDKAGAAPPSSMSIGGDHVGAGLLATALGAMPSTGASSPTAARMPSAQRRLGRVACRVVGATMPVLARVMFRPRIYETTIREGKRWRARVSPPGSTQRVEKLRTEIQVRVGHRGWRRASRPSLPALGFSARLCPIPREQAISQTAVSPAWLRS
jgi:hypothetical protein